jgi:hypothetical protein
MPISRRLINVPKVRQMACLELGKPNTYEKEAKLNKYKYISSNDTNERS